MFYLTTTKWLSQIRPFCFPFISRTSWHSPYDFSSFLGGVIFLQTIIEYGKYCKSVNSRSSFKPFIKDVQHFIWLKTHTYVE